MKSRIACCLVAFAALLMSDARAQDAKPQPAKSAPVLFLQISDPQLGMQTNNKNFEQEAANFEFFVATANRLKPAFVVVTGDLINKTGDAAQTAEYKRIAQKLNPAIKLYNVPGNHDVGNKPTEQSVAAHAAQFGADHYRFQEGSVVGLVLDSTLIHTPDAALTQYREQEEWLKAELKKAKEENARHIIIFQHHPLFLKSPDEADQYFNLPLARRAIYLDLFRQAGVTHVFTGHLHQDKVAREGSLEIVVTGSLGKPLNGSKSGFRIVAVRDEGIEHRYVDLGDIPNQIDPATWPAGEMLRGK